MCVCRALPPLAGWVRHARVRRWGGGAHRPFADLTRIMAWLRARPASVRVVIIQRERSMKALAASLRAAAPPVAPTRSREAGGAPRVVLARHTADPIELLHALRDATGGDLRPEHFTPMAFAQCFEALLGLLGYGRYQMRPSAFCGAMTVLVTTEDLTVCVCVSVCVCVCVCVSVRVA